MRRVVLAVGNKCVLNGKKAGELGVHQGGSLMEPRKTVRLAEIQRYADEIAKRFHPERIILFGSYAYGIPDRDSDVDLLVVMEFEGRAQEQTFKIRRALPRSFPLDLLARRPEELRQRIQMGDFFLREVLEKGIVLYERTRS